MVYMSVTYSLTPQDEMFHSISVTLGFLQVVKTMAINHVLRITNKKLSQILL